MGKKAHVPPSVDKKTGSAHKPPKGQDNAPKGKWTTIDDGKIKKLPV